MRQPFFLPQPPRPNGFTLSQARSQGSGGWRKWKGCDSVGSRKEGLSPGLVTWKLYDLGQVTESLSLYFVTSKMRIITTSSKVTSNVITLFCPQLLYPSWRPSPLHLMRLLNCLLPLSREIACTLLRASFLVPSLLMACPWAGSHT